MALTPTTELNLSKNLDSNATARVLLVLQEAKRPLTIAEIAAKGGGSLRTLPQVVLLLKHSEKIRIHTNGSPLSVIWKTYEAV